MLDALVLCAGTGTRMGVLTERCPKPLLPIGGRPALFWILDWLRNGGVRHVTLNFHYLPHVFYQALEAGYGGLALNYEEEPVLLGSAGTLRRHFLTFPNKPVLVVCGDVLTTLSLPELATFHTAKPIHPAATLVVHAVSDPQTGGVVTLRGERIVSFQEKPAQPTSPFIYGGIAVVDPDILAYLPETIPADIGTDVFPALCRSSFPVYGYRLEPADYLIDFGTPERYPRACEEWPERVNHDPVADTAAR